MIATAESLLAIDVGTINTRVALFDIVEGSYRFIAAGSAQTTAFAPYRDVSEGFSRAIDNLQELTGRRFLGPDAQLIVPAQPDGSGVDKCICTLSAGGPLKVVAVGLLEDVSLQSVQNLVSTTYAQVVGAISLNDQRVTSQRLDSIIRLQPDLIVIGGGTDGGASKSIAGLLESVGLACYLTPKEQRPEILFVGNQSLLESVSTQFNGLASFQSAPNIRPALEGEQLLPAHCHSTRFQWRWSHHRCLFPFFHLHVFRPNRLEPEELPRLVVQLAGYLLGNLLPLFRLCLDVLGFDHHLDHFQVVGRTHFRAPIAIGLGARPRCCRNDIRLSGGLRSFKSTQEQFQLGRAEHFALLAKEAADEGIQFLAKQFTLVPRCCQFSAKAGDRLRGGLLQQRQLRVQLEDLLLQGSGVHRSPMSDDTDSVTFNKS